MSRRTPALTVLGLAMLASGCTGHPSNNRTATEAATPRPPCGSERVRVSVGSASYLLDPLQTLSVAARVGDTLELSAEGPCGDRVHLYEHGGLIAVDNIRVHVAHLGKRMFDAEIPHCADVPPPCFGGLRSLGSVEVTARR